MSKLAVLSVFVAAGLLITSFAMLVPTNPPVSTGVGPVTDNPSTVNPPTGGDNGPVATPSTGSGGNPIVVGTPHIMSTSMKKMVVLRVYFHDYSATSLFTQAQVQALFDKNINELWKNLSYDNIGITAQVSSLFQLPSNRNQYITDHSNGDTSDGGQFDKVLNDAIANAPGGLDWTNLNAIMVLMAETSTSQFHRGQEATRNLHMGPGGATRDISAAIFSENPGEDANARWGRWCHEIGHAFQVAGPAHPSNYNSKFELMDANYPGQSGVFEKQSNMGFPGWLPTSKYMEITPAMGGAVASLWAEEYDPSGLPNLQAVKAKITDSLYYLISVRRAVRGDDLYGRGGTPYGIVDEGVLIERVTEGADQWVTLQGKGGDRDKLWHQDDSYSNPSDGIDILVDKKIDPAGDNYHVVIRYNKAANQPDVGMEPWTSPPGNTWETTDIWVDSPANGYGTYRWGFWNDLYGNPVPRGNGDPPTVSLTNRVYARVRNIGSGTATNVKVHFQITDPMGLGINGANGFIPLGDTDMTSFPALAAMAPGSFTDVYIDWTPSVSVSESELVDGLFAFHTCMRVIIDHVAGENSFGNQDGNGEQENFDLFQATPVSEGGSGLPYASIIHLRNDDLVKSKWFYLTYNSTAPAPWDIDINGGILGLQLLPDELRDIPVKINPIGPDPPLGSIFRVDVAASTFNDYVSDLDPTDVHTDFEPLGGVHVDVRVERPIKIEVVTTHDPTGGGVHVVGNLVVRDYSSFFDPSNPFTILVVGVDVNRRFMANLTMLLTVDSSGHFDGTLSSMPGLNEVTVLFQGSALLASGSTGFLPLQMTVDASLRLTPRTLNMKSKGQWVTARISFTDPVASLLDSASLFLQGTIPADRIQMLDGKTLLVKFDRAALIAVIAPGDTVTLCVTGKLMDGRTFKACDTVRVIRP